MTMWWNFLKNNLNTNSSEMLHSKSKKQLVISRYGESIDWIKKIEHLFQDIVIYEKSNSNSYHKYKTIKLKNVGRESHTYLHHIIDNYEELSTYDNILFCQANPFDHCGEFLEKLKISDNYTNDPFYFKKVGSHEITFYYEPIEKVHPIGLPVFNFYYHLFFDSYMKNLEQTRNSLMIIPTNNIKFRSKVFYEYLLKYLENCKNPLEGYIIERLWVPIFDGKTKDWISHYFSGRNKFLGMWDNQKIE